MYIFFIFVEYLATTDFLDCSHCHSSDIQEYDRHMLKPCNQMELRLDCTTLYIRYKETECVIPGTEKD